jgi:hypothetical protein
VSDRDAFEDVLSATLANSTDELITEARAIAARLERVAKDLEQRGTKAVVNSLGELQAQGTMFDVRCGAWNAEKKALRDYLAARDRAV